VNRLEWDEVVAVMAATWARPVPHAVADEWWRYFEGDAQVDVLAAIRHLAATEEHRPSGPFRLLGETANFRKARLGDGATLAANCGAIPGCLAIVQSLEYQPIAVMADPSQTSWSIRQLRHPIVVTEIEGMAPVEGWPFAGARWQGETA
jgi:hypothetical protein